MIRWLRIATCICLSLFAFLYMIGKSVYHHLDMTTFNKNRYYFLHDHCMEMYAYQGIDKHLIDDSKIQNLDDLMESSPYVLRVTSGEQSIIVGGAELTEYKIKQIYKGEGLNTGDSIQVYNYNDVGNDASTYCYGMTPVSSKKDYIVFLTKAPNPGIKGTYIYASFLYGKFMVSEEAHILYHYGDSPILVHEAALYDFIYEKDKVIGIDNDRRKQIKETFFGRYSIQENN